MVVLRRSEWPFELIEKLVAAMACLQEAGVSVQFVCRNVCTHGSSELIPQDH